MRLRRTKQRKSFRGLVFLGVVLGLTCSLTLISLLIATDPSFYLKRPLGLSMVKTGSFDTRYGSFGPALSETSVPPVVLLHGAFESVATWEKVAQRLAEVTHVEAYDLSGYGFTDQVGPFTLDGLVEQLHAFLIARHLIHPVLVGHSLGAGVIAGFVLRYPTLARAMVFVDGDGLAVNYPGSSLGGLLPDPYKTALYRSFVTNAWVMRSVFSSACGPNCPELSDQDLATLEAPFRLRGAEGALLSYGSRSVVGVTAAERNRLTPLHLPARVIVGAQDNVISLQAAKETAQVLGAPSPTVIAGQGHLALWSAPAAVAMPIEELLASLTPAKVGQGGH
jgi:pimeloyl-ACP methyl ester carboxylesterase